MRPVGVRMTYAKDGKGRKDMNISIDRIEQDRGYVMRPMNVRSSCACESTSWKHNLPEHEFFGGSRTWSSTRHFDK